MCDSLCAFQPDRTLFAKNSDRPPSEIQVLEAFAARPAGPILRTQYLELPDAGAAALVGSRPTWLWGLEQGVNVHRVAIGNEQLWTTDNPADEPDALTGMDLVRLGLERGRTAEHALDVVTALIDEYGQGGIGDRDEGKAYFSSFLIADPTEAWVLETSARSWAARRVDPAERGVALSNRISLATDFSRASNDVAAVGDFDHWRRATSPTAHADRRLAVSRPGVQAVAASADADTGARELAALLRHHGADTWGRPGHDPAQTSGLPPAVIDRLGTGVSLCLHLDDVQATTASMIASLPRDQSEPLRAWVAPGNPCVTVFLPTFGVDGIAPELAQADTWHRFETLRTRVDEARAAGAPGSNARDRSATALAEIRAVLAPVEADLWDEADHVAGQSADQHAPWARGVWPRVDLALRTLGA